MPIGDTGIEHFVENGWRIVDELSTNEERRVILTTNEAGGAELSFAWHKNDDTGNRWQVKEAHALLPGVSEWFPVSMTALFYVGGTVPASDCIAMVKKRAPKEIRKLHDWA